MKKTPRGRLEKPGHRRSPGGGAAAPTGPGATGAAPPGRGRLLLAAAVIVAAGLAAYSNSFQGVFLLDDEHTITANENVRHLWPPWQAMFDPQQGNRPVVALSLAANYALGGLDVQGYHAVNLAVHLLAALVLFGLVRRTLLLERLKERFGRAAFPLALAMAVLWMVHPLQTESVTYVIQRAESMMGLALLATLYFTLRGATSARPRRWYAAAVVACAVGMGTKETMLISPLVVLLYDRTLVARSFAEVFRRRWGLYAGLAATWGVFAAIAAIVMPGMSGAEVRGAASPGTYAVTQLEVVAHYLRLAFWPDRLCFHYEWAMAHGLGDVWPWAILMAALAAATLLTLWRRSPMGFLGLWFFVTLAPTSSLWPVEDPVFEHRMYLPLAGVVVAVVLGAYVLGRSLLDRIAGDAARRRRLGRLAGAAGLVLAAAVAATLAVLTVRRNEDYGSAVRMWTDVVGKCPANPLARNNLGSALVAEGQRSDALPHFAEAVRLNPKFANARNNLGVALAQEGRFDEAVAQLSEAARLDPASASTRGNLARASRLLAWQLAASHDDARRDGARAVQLAREACRLTGDADPRALDALAAAYAETGRFDIARETAQKALDLARKGGDQRLTPAILARLRLYRRDRPFREPPPRPSPAPTP